MIRRRCAVAARSGRSCWRSYQRAAIPARLCLAGRPVERLVLADQLDDVAVAGEREEEPAGPAVDEDGALFDYEAHERDVERATSRPRLGVLPKAILGSDRTSDNTRSGC